MLKILIITCAAHSGGYGYDCGICLNLNKFSSIILSDTLQSKWYYC